MSFVAEVIAILKFPRILFGDIKSWIYANGKSVGDFLEILVSILFVDMCPLNALLESLFATPLLIWV